MRAKVLTALNNTYQMQRSTDLYFTFWYGVYNRLYAMAIYFMHYNFVRIHQTFRVTPAMAAGVTDKLLDLEVTALLLDKQAPAKRGPYKKKVA
jgi:hypothetical protein